MKTWEPVSDRKLRVGIIGANFGVTFGFQNHPNVEVVAVSDLDPAKARDLAEACHASTVHASLDEMVRDDRIEAVFVATDAPSHADHCIQVLEHGKHVGCAVPAVFGNLEDADRLFETVKSSGLTYMMFETSAFHEDCHAMRTIYRQGGFGRMVYTEGEYYHYMDIPIGSHEGWRVGLPPQWYPTHATAYYTCVTGGTLTEVSCLGIPSSISHLQPDKNPYRNPFGTEVALFRTSEGGMARMAVSWDTQGHGVETGRVRGELGSMTGMSFEGETAISGWDLERPPLVDVAWALNMTVAGIVAHQSALKDGELLKIPQYKWS